MMKLRGWIGCAAAGLAAWLAAGVAEAAENVPLIRYVPAGANLVVRIDGAGLWAHPQAGNVLRKLAGYSAGDG